MITSQVVSSSTKTVLLSNGKRARTKEVIYKEVIGKKKNGKVKYNSWTRHEVI